MTDDEIQEWLDDGYTKQLRRERNHAMISNELQEKIARLYFGDQHSPYDIASELELDVKDVNICVEQLTSLADIIRRVMLDRISAALGIYE